GQECSGARRHGLTRLSPGPYAQEAVSRPEDRPPQPQGSERSSDPEDRGGSGGKRPLTVPDAGSFLTTGDMARRSGDTLRTVRFYEEEGILRPVRRTDGGHRLFDQRELDRLTLVTDLRAAGLSLDEIKQILEVKQHSGVAGEAARHASDILARRIQELREKLAVLARLQDDLARTTDVMTIC